MQMCSASSRAFKELNQFFSGVLPHICCCFIVSFSPRHDSCKTNNKQAAKLGMKPDVGSQMDLLKGF